MKKIAMLYFIGVGREKGENPYFIASLSHRI